MNNFEIAVVVILSVSLLLAIPYGLFEHKILHKLSPLEQESLTFEKSVAVSEICFFIMLFLSIASLVLFLFACAEGSKVNEQGDYYFICAFSGLWSGFVIGFVYYLKIRKPYLLQHYPEDMKKYKEEQRKVPGCIRMDYLSWTFVGFFVLFFFDFGTLLSFILVYAL